MKKYLDSKGEEDVRGNQTFDLRTTIPTDEWPMDMATSPVRVTLEHGGTAFVVQPGQADRGSGIRTYDFHKLLAAPSQPLDVVARRSVGLRMKKFNLTFRQFRAEG